MPECFWCNGDGFLDHSGECEVCTGRGWLYPEEVLNG